MSVISLPVRFYVSAALILSCLCAAGALFLTFVFSTASLNKTTEKAVLVLHNSRSTTTVESLVPVSENRSETAEELQAPVQCTGNNPTGESLAPVRCNRSRTAGKPAETAEHKENGLTWKDLRRGEGSFPRTGQTLTVHYTGTFANGKKFDSSYDQAGPFRYRFGAGEVIAGWEQGIATMRVHGRRIITVPPCLGYGDQDRPGVPANSTLIFDVELLSTSDN